MVWLGIILVVLMLVVFTHAVEKIKYGEFEDVSSSVMVFGIYYWGQGLILAPFWILFGIACIFWWPPNMALVAYLWFQIVRAGLEMVMVTTTDYKGLSEVVIPDNQKLSKANRLQLYLLSQALVIMAGVILLTVK